MKQYTKYQTDKSGMIDELKTIVSQLTGSDKVAAILGGLWGYFIGLGQLFTFGQAGLLTLETATKLFLAILTATLSGCGAVVGKKGGSVLIEKITLWWRKRKKKR